MIELKFDANNKLLSLSKDDQNVLNAIDNKTKLYIDGHCNLGSSTLSNDNGASISECELAHIISKSTTIKRLTHLNINLHCCSAAADSSQDSNDNFASKFLNALATFGVKNTMITAYNEVVSISRNPFTNRVVTFTRPSIHRDVTLSKEVDTFLTARNELHSLWYHQINDELKKLASIRQLDSRYIDMAFISLSLRMVFYFILQIKVAQHAQQLSAQLDKENNILKSNGHLRGNKFIYFWENGNQVKHSKGTPTHIRAYINC